MSKKQHGNKEAKKPKKLPGPGPAPGDPALPAGDPPPRAPKRR